MSIQIQTKQGDSFPLHKKTVTIGVHPSAGILLTSQVGVEDIEAQIRFVSGRFLIEVFSGELNINGDAKRIHWIQPGDEITDGNGQLLFAVKSGAVANTPSVHVTIQEMKSYSAHWKLGLPGLLLVIAMPSSMQR